MALVFNGSSQYGRFPNQADANAVFDSSAAYSLAVWYKPSGQATEAHVVGTDAGTASGVTRFSGFTYRGDSGNYLAYYKASVTTYHNIQVATTNGWNLAIITRPSGAGVTITAATSNLDTTLAGTYGSSNYESHGFSVGARMSASSVLAGYFNGKIAEVAVWKGRQLTSGEIDSLQAGARFNTISSGLTEYIDLLATSSGTATTLTTISGKVMTFTGSPTYDADSPYISSSVTDVNSDEIVRVGGSVAITTVATPSASGSTVGGKSLTSFSGSNDSYAGTMPPLVDGFTYPAYGTQLLVLTNGSNNPSISVTLAASTTSQYVTLVSVNTTFGTLAYFSSINGLTMSVGDTITSSLPANLGVTTNQINDDSSIETDYEGVQTFWHRSVSTGMITALIVTTGADISTGGITRVGLTAAGLTRIGLCE